MKTIDHLGIRSVVLATALGAGMGFVTHASADDSYLIDLNSKAVTRLGSLGGESTTATAINDAGQVVGYSDTAGGQEHAFITGSNGVGMRDLGTLRGNNSEAYGIDAAGEVVGYSATSAGQTHAFITGPNGGGMRDLGTLGGNYSQAYGINAAGEVVGYSATSADQPHAFITGPNGGGMRDLGTLGGNYSWAYGINAAGQVVGSSYTAAGQEHAFITGPNGVGMTDLGTLPRVDYSKASGINDAGQVVGDSTAIVFQYYPDPDLNSSYLVYHAFITGPNGVGMTDLGTLSGNGSQAYGINDAGQVVGGSYTAVPQFYAFITGPHGVGMTDLNSLVDLPAGVVLDRAVAINNTGQVIALVIPEPQSYALLLAGLVLTGVMTRRKQKADAQSRAAS